MTTQTLPAQPQLDPGIHKAADERGPKLVLLAALILLGCGLLHLHVLNRWMAGRSDLTSPWVGSRVALAGGDAYALPATQEIQRLFFHRVLPASDPDNQQQAFVYPLYTTLLLAPLAWMPLLVARIVFTAAAILGVALMTLLWLRMLDISFSRWRAAAYFAAALVSWPTLVALRHQQLTLVALVFLSCGVYAQQRKHSFAAGVLLACATIKPQFVGLAILWCLARAIFRREWRLPAWFSAALTFLFLAAELLHRGWVTEWVVALNDYHRYTHSRPSLTIFFGTTVGATLLLAMALFSLAALARALPRHPSSRQFALEISLALALGVAVCPTNIHWIYNQTLLLPGCFYLVGCGVPEGTPRPSKSRVVALWFLGVSLLSVPLAVLGESLTGPSSGWDFLPYMNLLLPCVLSVALAAALAAKRTGPAHASA